MIADPYTWEVKTEKYARGVGCQILEARNGYLGRRRKLPLEKIGGGGRGLWILTRCKTADRGNCDLLNRTEERAEEKKTEQTSKGGKRGTEGDLIGGALGRAKRREKEKKNLG